MLAEHRWILLAAHLACAAIGCASSLGPEDVRQLRYCGPSGPRIAESEGVSLDFDLICGRSAITAKRPPGPVYPPTKLETLPPPYRIISHFAGQPEEIKKDEEPAGRYVIVGHLEFPLRWYYSATVGEYMREEVSELGGHAVLRYDTYQDRAAAWKDEITGNLVDAYHMRMTAEVIRFVEVE